MSASRVRIEDLQCLLLARAGNFAMSKLKDGRIEIMVCDVLNQDELILEASTQIAALRMMHRKLDRYEKEHEVIEL